MATSYVGQIMVWGGMFAPLGWLPCDGSLQSISNYNTLFALIGTTFGGDGQNTFGLPNLQGGVMIHQGQLTGGQQYTLGQNGGASSVTLNAAQLPVHGHTLNAVSKPSSGTATPGGSTLLADAGGTMYAPGPTTNATLASGSIGPAGGSSPHPNMQPVLGLIACICYDGIYPTPS